MERPRCANQPRELVPPGQPGSRKRSRAASRAGRSLKPDAAMRAGTTRTIGRRRAYVGTGGAMHPRTALRTVPMEASSATPRVCGAPGPGGLTREGNLSGQREGRSRRSEVPPSSSGYRLLSDLTYGGSSLSRRPASLFGAPAASQRCSSRSAQSSLRQPALRDRASFPQPSTATLDKLEKRNLTDSPDSP